MSGSDRWSYVKGYVIIRVTGAGLESWVNRVVGSGIPLWDVSRPLPDTLVARVRRTDFPRLRRFRRRRVRYRVLGRLGWLFRFGTLWRRRGLVAGAVAFVLAFYLATSYVWFVDIEAPAGLDQRLIRDVAGRAGLRVGQRIDRIDAAAVERRLQLDLPWVAWASLQMRGTRALLQVAERPGWGEPVTAYGHVVADRDGVVVRVVPLRGQPVVAPGDTVARGQVLISGLLPPGGDEYTRRVEEGKLPYERAEGRVYARVWYEEYGEAPLVEWEPVLTGRRETFHLVTTGPYRWRIGRAESRFEHYTEQRQIRWGRQGLGWDWRWETVIRDEVNLRRTERDPAEALAAATAAAKRRIEAMRKPESESLEERVEVLSRGEADGRVRVRVLVEAREDIAVFEPVVGGEGETTG